MEFVVGAIILAGCIIGGSILANGIIADVYRQRKIEIKRREILNRQRMEEEEAAWRGVNTEMKRELDSLMKEVVYLRQQIKRKDKILQHVMLKDIEKIW